MAIYLDHNATTPTDPAVTEAVAHAMKEAWGNPSTIYGSGRRARKILENARASLAALIGATDPADIAFTSGGTEADYLALAGSCLAFSKRRNHLLTTMVEHKAVLRTCAQLENRGFRITYLPVDASGRVDPAAVSKAITTETGLVSIMLANNEVGTISALAEISRICREAEVLIHTDAVQAIGKIPVDVEYLGVDLLTLSGHKFYGPKGAGALWIRKGVPLVSVLAGGTQERGLRPGTENVPAIYGMGVAAEMAATRLQDECTRIRALRDRLWQGIRELDSTTKVHGDLTTGLPNVLNVSFDGWDAEDMVLALDKEGIEAGTGSACTTGQTSPSHVLLAMGISPREAYSAVRFSLGRGNVPEEIDAVIAALIRILKR
jgi:cysteine desulfurase